MASNHVIRTTIVLASWLCLSTRLVTFHFGTTLAKTHPKYYLYIKKMFSSCNPTLTSFLFKKIPTLKFLPPSQLPINVKTCIKHTLLTKKIMQFFPFYRPTYPICRISWKHIIFLRNLSLEADAPVGINNLSYIVFKYHKMSLPTSFGCTTPSFGLDK